MMQRIPNIPSLSSAETDVPFDGDAERSAWIRGESSSHPVHASHRSSEVSDTPDTSGFSTSTLMVINNSPTIRNIVGMCLSREGYRVVGFADGGAALRWLAHETQSRPGLILLETSLVKAGVYKVLCTLKTILTGKKMTLIILGRPDGIVDRLKRTVVGAREYLSKPFTTEQVVELAHRYLDE
jgi:twitching motility two-component system response regulator PilG